MTMLPLLVALLGPAAPAEAVSSVGVVELELADPSRADPLAGGERRWRVALYYPAQPGTGTPRAYAHDPALLARMAKDGYYEVAPATLEAWARQPDGARLNARALAAAVPLVTLSPGSGVAAFNYSELAASIVRRGYAVAVIDHPYLGLTHLADGRILSAHADPVQQSDDPKAWQPRVVEWARDVSATLDLLPAQATVRATGLALDSARVLAVGHSLGGTVAVEVCEERYNRLGYVP